ncbi:hypothetical protein RJ639_002304 [Escallonia herrerae]|uniref:Dirigent protein n=1 Tax=Escallonia herrerae TaxID=1293975 RepID=A0AA89BHK3_9ASTE|nr:hypothetical protein RJ639_002304 [Escallonia herrerae]
MASSLTYSLFPISFILFLSSFIYTSTGAFSEDLSDAILTKRMEKHTHLHFYFHDVLSGKHPSSIRIAGKPKPGAFGDTYIIDDALTEGPNATSRVVGRAQGMYAISAQDSDVALLMVVNYAFALGKYNGSSISVFGRNPVFHDVREMPIVGGSGLFRFASGYALAHTIWFDFKTGDAIVEVFMFEGQRWADGYFQWLLSSEDVVLFLFGF